MTFSAFVLFTVKVTTPDAVLVSFSVEIVEVPDCVRATVLPDSKLPLASFSVTVISEVASPSAATLGSLAVTVDAAAFTGTVGVALAELV